MRTNVVTHEGWVGGAVVMGCLIVILAVGLWWERRWDRAAEQARARQLAAIDKLKFLSLDDIDLDREPSVVDALELQPLSHARCVYRDGDGNQCPATLCFCSTLHPATGQPVTCDGAEPPWCSHSLVSRATTGGHCYRHQKSCADCSLEDASLFGHVR
jgi:hypothetical protein